ncbi:hypothetical protein MKX01_035736 [Papaver californicum]|nr:hypothetical protein MKX01_035736 [Papaver californicum]
MAASSLLSVFCISQIVATTTAESAAVHKGRTNPRLNSKLCNMTATIASFNDGKTVIKLDKPGSFYFISGALDHCKKGNQTSPPSRPPSAQPSIAVPPQLEYSPAPITTSKFRGSDT